MYNQSKQVAGFSGPGWLVLMALDILIILGFALGGSAAEKLAQYGIKMGKGLTAAAVKKALSKEAIKKLSLRLGIEIAEENILRFVLPLASIFIGSSLNAFTMKKIGKTAKRIFEQRIIV